MLAFLRTLMVLGATSALVACGSDAGDGSTGSGGSSSSGGSGGTSSELFPNAPDCKLGFVEILGSLAGEPYDGGSSPTDWRARSITFGTGEVEGGTFGPEGELKYGEQLSLGKKVALTSGFLYVSFPHSLTMQYLCIQAGELGLIKAPPSSDSVLLEFSLTAGALGQYCEGAPVNMSLNGCISRTSTFVP